MGSGQILEGTRQAAVCRRIAGTAGSPESPEGFLAAAPWSFYILVVILLPGAGWNCCSSVRTVPVDEEEEESVVEA